MATLTEPPAGPAVPLAWQIDLYMPFIRSLPITGISLSVVGETGHESTICTSDSLAGRIEELQFALGEGPHWQAMKTGRPSIVSNLRDDAQPVWPVFADAVRELGVGALFAFPLMLGAAIVGVANMYRGRPGGFDPRDMDAALRLAAAAAAPAVERATRAADSDLAHPTGPAPEMRREVQQATGMILVQLDISATEALQRLKAYAFSHNRGIQSVASDVVSRRLDFRHLN